MKQLIIVGASGHGKVVADIARRVGYQEVLFLDDNKAIKECGGHPVVGISEDMAQFDCDIIIAIGDAKVRQRLQYKLEESGKNVPVLIHPTAVIAEGVSVEAGTVVMAGAVINPASRIGKGCIINTCASVDHDCDIGDYAHISVGAHLAGMVEIGARTWVGIGAVISNDLKVASDCVIGAGGVVIDTIKEPGVYVGVPAKRVSQGRGDEV